MKDLQNSWYVASWSQDIGIGEPYAMSILNQPLVLWRTPEGEVRALEDRCMHRGAPLSLGRCVGKGLRCSYHGLVFDDGGQVVQIPGRDSVPPQARVRSFPAVDRHGWIWVWMGEAERANPDRIPDMLPLDTPDYHLGPSTYDFDAEARLVRENLLDYSHIPFLHADSFGISEDWATTPVGLTELDDGVEYRRWVLDQPLVPGSPLRMDVYSVFSLRVPGIIRLWNGYYPLGTAAELDHGVPPEDYPGVKNVNSSSQAVTPMTDKTTRYFFSWGPRKDCGDETIRDGLIAIAGMAFAEDKIMVEAQQREFDRAPERGLLALPSDEGINTYRKVMARFLREAGELESA